MVVCRINESCWSIADRIALFYKKYSVAFWCCLALAIVGTWLSLVGRQMAFDPPFSLQTKNAFYIGRLVALASFIAIPYTFAKHGVTIARLGGMAISVGTVFCAVAYGQTLFPPEAIRNVGFFVCGASYQFCIIPMYVTLARTYPLKIAIGVATSVFIVRTFISLCLWGILSGEALVLCVVLLPIAAALCAPYHRLIERVPKQKKKTPRLSGTASTYLVFLGITASATLLVLQTVSAVGLVGGVSASDYRTASTTSMLGSAVSCLVLAALAYATLIAGRKKPVTTRYLRAFLALACAMLLTLPIELINSAPFSLILEECLVGAEFFGHVLMWTLLMDAVQRCRIPAFRCAGIIPFIPNLFNLAIDSNIIAQVAVDNGIFALLVGYALIVIVTVILPSIARRQLSFAVGDGQDINAELIDGEPDEDDIATQVALEESFELRCNYLIDHYNLTPRESDVFRLLAQGRNRAVLRSDLSISESTAKTHIAHIYAKMGIGSHQELLDEVYRDYRKNP